MEITAPAAERLSLNASDCCFIKRKRNRFSNAGRNRGANILANRDAPRDAGCISRACAVSRDPAADASVSSLFTNRQTGSRDFYEGKKTDYEATWNAETRRTIFPITLCWRIYSRSRITISKSNEVVTSNQSANQFREYLRGYVSGYINGVDIARNVEIFVKCNQLVERAVGKFYVFSER